jgi:ABC-type Zn uptake system ZnuABC Zn-binding protein ZnuA
VFHRDRQALELLQEGNFRREAGHMRTQDVKLILLGAYFDPRHAQFLAQHTDAKVVNMAHQVGARPQADGYFGMMDYNIQQIQTALTPPK